MKTARITILVEPEMKKEANKVFGKIGMPLATAVRMLMRYAIDNKTCPCHIFEPNAETIKAMEDAKDPKNLIRFDSLDDFKKAIDNA